MKEFLKDIISSIYDFSSSIGDAVTSIIFLVILLAIIFGVIILCIWSTTQIQRWGEKGSKQRELIVSIILNGLFVSLVLSVVIAVVYFLWEGLLYILGLCTVILLLSSLSKYLDRKGSN